MTFTTGQRVRTTTPMHFPADDFTVPSGSLGTITNINNWPAEDDGTYGVTLDDDPKHLPTLCWPEEIAPA